MIVDPLFALVVLLLILAICGGFFIHWGVALVVLLVLLVVLATMGGRVR